VALKASPPGGPDGPALTAPPASRTPRVRRPRAPTNHSVTAAPPRNRTSTSSKTVDIEHFFRNVDLARPGVSAEAPRRADRPTQRGSQRARSGARVRGVVAAVVDPARQGLRTNRRPRLGHDRLSKSRVNELSNPSTSPRPSPIPTWSPPRFHRAATEVPRTRDIVGPKPTLALHDPPRGRLGQDIYFGLSPVGHFPDSLWGGRFTKVEVVQVCG
jgi:hypothetical protein